MKKIEFIENFDLTEKIESGKTVREVFKGEGRRLIEVKLGNNSVLSKHLAVEPITVLCLAGKGKFRAGENLEDELQLKAGTLLTLAPNIEHEVIAEPDIHLLVTKFTGN